MVSILFVMYVLTLTAATQKHNLEKIEKKRKKPILLCTVNIKAEEYCQPLSIEFIEDSHLS